MYCKNCKKSGSIFDKYCKYCGIKLEHKRLELDTVKKTIRIIIISFVLLLLVFIGCKAVNYFNSPEHAAKVYFNALINNDIDKIYSYLNTEESEFVSKTILADKIDFFDDVNNYEVISTKQYQNYIIVKINYTTNKETNVAYVKLVKTNNILGRYKVISGKIVNNVKFKVPSGSKVTVDNVELTNYKSEDNFDIYTINSMIKGTYQVKIEANDLIIDEEVEIEDDSTYTISNINISEELENTLISKTKDELNYIYDSILSEKTFDEIKSHYLSETNQLKSSYNSLKRTMSSNITSVKIIDLEIKKATYSTNGKLLITYLVDQKITLNEETISKTGYIQVEYDYINNNYEIYNISR